jgi:acetate kinase
MTGATERVILVLNAGSSSIKFRVFRREGSATVRDLRGQVAGLATQPRFTLRRGDAVIVDVALGDGPLAHAQALDHLISAVQRQLGTARIEGVGHRVVHGGLEFMAPIVVDESILQRLDRYVPLAPLHQPHNLAAIHAMLQRLPGVPQVACFDTAFHRTVPEVAQLFALPPRFAEAGIRRYGFHGLSYEYIASRLPALDARAAAGRVVVFHLGNGASMCALQGGRSVATTMGFTAVDGLPMGTRCGAMDPGVVLFLMDEMRLGPREIERLIYNESGLLGMSGVSSDVRDLLASREPAAALALDVFVYRASRELGSMVAALGGLDAIVFTAGIGENQAEIRARIGRQAAWLGVQIDPAANLAHGPRISSAASRTAAWVVPTDEESMIARHVLGLLPEGDGTGPLR